MVTALLEARGLVKEYSAGNGWWGARSGVLRAVDGVDLVVEAGECLALVGESACGKSTLGRLLVGLEEPDAGAIRWQGEDLGSWRGRELRRRRRGLQMIFQDPGASLDPRLPVERSLLEALAAGGPARGPQARVRLEELLELVGLPESVLGRRPRQLSGGQRQRVCVARALLAEPRLLVADEPLTALDLPVQAQVLNLLAALQERLGLALLLIAHDLARVEQVADRVAVMYRGRVVEEAPAPELFTRPLHPYTRALLAAVPRPEPGRRRWPPPTAEVPRSPPHEASCVYQPRCSAAQERCRREAPSPRQAGDEHHFAACFFPLSGLGAEGRSRIAAALPEDRPGLSPAR